MRTSPVETDCNAIRLTVDTVQLMYHSERILRKRDALYAI